MILLQERKTLSRCDHNVAVGGLKLSGQDLQKSRFSCAVGANETAGPAPLISVPSIDFSFRLILETPSLI